MSLSRLLTSRALVRRVIQTGVSICLLTVVLLSAACSGGGSANNSASPTVANAPTVSISSNSMSVFVGQPLTLTWSSTNATSCIASGAWVGTPQTSGSQNVTPNAAGNLTYSLTCTGAGGTASASTTVDAMNPTLSVTNVFAPNSTTISTSEGAPYGDCDFWPSGSTVPSWCLSQSNYGYGPTKVMRLYICLSGEVTLGSCSQQPAVTGPLSTTMLNAISSGIAAYAGTGIRLIIRFTYNFGPIGSAAMDAPIDVISRHIDQLAPILLQNKDLIFALEAGFIGTWGEWHDSTNGNDTAAAQKVVLDKELSYFSGVFPILVRYPSDLIQYLGNSTPPEGLGLHDDYYASASDDAGTWDTCITTAGFCLTNETAGQLQSFAAAVSTTTMFVGEFGAVYPELQDCSDLDHYSHTYNPQSISLNLSPSAVGAELQNEGCVSSFYNKVGTRIELQQATMIGNPTPNGKLYVALTLANTGYGRVIRERPASLVFASNGSTVAQIPIVLADMDLRQLASAYKPVQQTFQFNVTLPANFPSSGWVTASLLIPDPAPSLSAQPAYALPLNSLDRNNNPIFDPATGYNVIATLNAN